MYELIIVGGGPGGVAAGVYAARKKIKTALITDSFGGQSIVSNDIQNWIGVKSLTGLDLAKMLEEHLRAQAGFDIVDGDSVTQVSDVGDKFALTTQGGKNLETKYLLLATGSRHRKLNIPGEKEFDGKGIVYCSTCDAPLFSGKAVAIVGGGNAGLEAALDSLPYAAKIYLLERSGQLKGDPVTQEKIKADPKVEVILNAESQRVSGDQFVNALVYKDLPTGEEKTLAVEGVFVEIGAVPNAEFVKDLVERNKFGEVVVNHQTQATSHPRIWAAGDVSDVLYKQNNVSAGDAVKAVLNIYEKISKG